MKPPKATIGEDTYGMLYRFIPIFNLNSLGSVSEGIFVGALNIVVAGNLVWAPNREVPAVAVVGNKGWYFS